MYLKRPDYPHMATRQLICINTLHGQERQAFNKLTAAKAGDPRPCRGMSEWRQTTQRFHTEQNRT